MQQPGRDPDPWPPLDIGEMIADMERHPTSIHWQRTLEYVHSWAIRLVRPEFGYRYGPDDLTQNVMLILMQPGKLSTFRGVAMTATPDVVQPRAFCKYLRVMTRLTLKDMVRSATTEKKYLHKYHVENDGDPPDEHDPLDQLTSQQPSIEDQLIAAEDLADVGRYLAKLAATNADAARSVAELLRSVFTSEDYQGIVDRYQRNPSSVRLHIFRIRRKLRMAFSDLAPSATGKRSSQKPGRASSQKTPKQQLAPRAAGRQKRPQPATPPALEQPLSQTIGVTLPSPSIDQAAQPPTGAPPVNHGISKPASDETIARRNRGKVR
ncbi:MAG TPA: hypothetical protein VFX24_08665 [Ktedonobacterales bacterium]|nr:hypothetical protein [Ktedonobacterales bacterium]